MYAIIDLYDQVSFFLIILLFVVSWLLVRGLTNKDYLANLSHGNVLELVWTISPAAILWAIGLPSLNLLYMMDEIIDAEITVKAIANQWYWTYSLAGAGTDGSQVIEFDSFLVAPDGLELGDQRQLTVDNYLVLPVNTSIRILVTSNDVIHSFAIPSLA
jgi:heme/copper-type cytochrome/quinol oxidase subunit 2